MSSLYMALFAVCAFNAITEGATTMDEELDLSEELDPHEPMDLFETLDLIAADMAQMERMLRRGRPGDCLDLYFAGQNHSGIYNIFPIEGSTERVSAYCDMESDGGGWTVIQRRGQFGNPAYYFYKDWEAYARGFGDPAKEYWLGNRAIHALTRNGTTALRIQLKNHTGELRIVDYKVFKVASEEELFRVTLGGYRGEEGGDALGFANGAAFSARDRDHDMSVSKHCAEMYKGGWWYKACHDSNLNGLNLNGKHDSYADGIEWSTRHGRTGLQYYSYPEAEMKIRRLLLEDRQGDS